MSLLTIGGIFPNNQTISHSENDSVAFVGTGTLNVTGTAQSPITVTLSSVAGAGVLDTLNLTYATVTIDGFAGASALVNYNVGAGSTLELESLLGVGLGSTITFTAPKSHLILDNTVDLSLLGNLSIAGFGPGSNIDIKNAAFASYSYADNAGTGTGGTLTLRDSGGNTIGSVILTTGEFTAASFNVHLDGTGGTLIDFATYVSGLSATPGTADLTVGGAVIFQLATTGPVTIAGGTPTLTLNDGGVATYDSVHSTPTNLVFKYIVQPGQNTADLATTGINLHGATATDLLGNAVSLAGGIGNPAGILQIDTTPPTITGVTTNPGSGDLNAGHLVAITVAASEAVTVTGGTPTLTLNDGAVATYDRAHSTATNLVFDYTVQAGDNTAALAVTGASLNGATIADGAGNAANLAGVVATPAGTLQIDTTPPTITGVTTNPGSGDLGVGQVVGISVAASEAVTVVGGTPTLTLNDGGVASYDAAHSTATNLVFDYTVQAGDNTADLAVTGASLNGATIADGAGNAANLAGVVANPAGTLQIDTTAPTITGVTTNPGSGTLAAGQVVAFAITASKAVTVAGGTPTLALNDGGVASYDAADSTPTTLIFKYAVQPGQNTAALAVTGTNLNGATIADGAGNAANLAGAIGNPPGTLQVDTTRPAVTSVFGVATTPGSGDLAAGSTVTLTVTLTGSATVTGTPTLTLSDGGSATYDPTSSSPTALVFRHVVQAGQNTPDLAVTSVQLNSGTVLDGSGNAVDLSGAVTNPAGVLQIDTIAPTITGVSTNPGNGDLGAGQVVAIDVATSEAVIVAGGTPSLTLNDGGLATYDAAHSTATNLVFDYTVQAGDNTAALAVTGANLNGATIADGAGNAANLAGVVATPAGTLQIDTTPPTITGVTTNPGSGDLGAGQIVAISVAASEAVTVVGGTPTLALNDGGAASYDAARSTATNLVFDYTVQAGDNTADLAVTGASLNGAIIADGAGNAANLAGVVANPAGILQIDTTAPTITGVGSTPGSGSVRAGQMVAIDLTASEAVTVAGGTPTLTLNDGGNATYDAAHSTATNLVFDYTVQAGDNTAALAVTGANLNGASIADGAGNAATLAAAMGSLPGTLRIDTTAPTITNVATSPGSGAIGPGQTVSISLTPSEAVTVAGGTPTLALNDGGTATYDAAHSTPTNLVFRYTVQPGDSTADLAITGANLNGATITDPAGNLADLAGAVGNPAGTLQIDGTTPTITGASTNPGSGDLAAGQAVAITLTASEAVTVAGGSPTLTLNDGGTATYDAARSTPTQLVFDYTVQPNQNTPDLAITGSNLNGATISNAAGVAGGLAGAIGNPPGTLQIDTIAPTVTAVTTTPGSGDLTAGQVVAISITPSAPVTVAGGTPTLTLNDGGIATYDPNSSTPTNLVFKYVVQPGDTTSDLTVTGSHLNGATISDQAGNPVDLTGAVGNPAGTLQIDTSRPAITSVYGVATTPGSGDLGVGSAVTLQVTLTGSATVSGGTPTLTLSDGGTATYDPTRSTPAVMVFRHTVQPGQNTADLAVTAVMLNGAAVTDSAGHAVDLSGAVVNPGGVLQIDTTAPTVGTVTTSPGSGSFGAGQVITINLPTSAAVTVSGGTPTLTLNDGGTATYDAVHSTATNLVFSNTVRAGDNAAQLAVTGANLNGATIADGAGNALDLSGSVGNPAGSLQIDTTAPTVTAVAAQPGTGTATEGDVVAINVTPSEAVIVSGGTPTLTLNDGGTATYDAADSTAALMVFDYVVQPGQNTADLAVTASNLNGATIADPAGNRLDLSGAVGSLPDVLDINTVPVVTSVEADPPNGDLNAGKAITLTVDLSGPVTITGGSPTLSLSDGGVATYDASSSTPTTLVFRNTVQAGQNTPDLAVSAAFLNGAVITDGSGHAVSLAGAVGNPAGILQVDTIAPYALSVVMGGSLDPGGLFTVTTYVSEPVTVSGGPFMLQLANGGFATYNAALSTPTALVSSYLVPTDGSANHLTAADVATVNYLQNGAHALDGAGNDLSVPSVAAAAAAAQGNFSDVSGGASPTTIDVYRFFDKTTGTHFYTPDPNERQTILNTRPDLVPEGANGVGLTAVNPASNDPNAAPVYRFFDTTQGTQFITASAAERDTVIASRPDMVFEPTSTFYEHVTPQAGDTPVYRFFDTTYGTHFYTDDPVERGVIQQTRPDLVLEGIGFYEPMRNPAT